MKFYNYLFYLTLQWANWCAHNLIFLPLCSLFRLLSVSEERISRTVKTLATPQGSTNGSSNLSFARHFMFWSFTLLMLTIEQRIFKILKLVESEYSFLFMFVIAFCVSFLFNYFMLEKSDRYKRYFDKFKKENRHPAIWILAMFYHLIIFVVSIMNMLA